MSERKKMEETDLKRVLDKCNETAKIGFKIASSEEKNISRALNIAQEKLQNVIFDLNNSKCYVPGVTRILEKQLIDIKDSFGNLSILFKDDLIDLKENLSKFSITLFGRTMAGKSTLMEILTEGDGKSIGKGSQRTTKDIRTYLWNGLEITDVPGIGAFKGEEDEQIAFAAAKKADLILFLITDDAPQIVEAECFSKIVSLGKPIICIINVKTSISENKSLKLTMRDINKGFDQGRLNAITKQFLNFSNKFGQDWGDVPFIYVHLKAAFIAQNMDYDENSQSLYELSKIDLLKKKIVTQVKTNGEFYRIKTFIDIIANPMLENIDILLEQSQMNRSQAKTMLIKRRQLEEWRAKFYRNGMTRIQSVITKVKGDLYREVASFSEEYFSDKKASKVWEKKWKDEKVDKKCDNLLKELDEICIDRVKEFSRELISELKFSSAVTSSKSLGTKKVIDKKRIWKWGEIITDGGFALAILITTIISGTIATPLAVAGVGATVIGIIGSFLFKSREKREREARIRLEKTLREDIDKKCEIYQEKTEKNLKYIIERRIDRLVREMDKIDDIIFKLADTQKKLAWQLNDYLAELNKNIVSEAIKLIEADGLQYHILDVARIPGNITMIKLREETIFPTEQVKELGKLMAETILFVHDNENKRTFISKVLGREGKGVNIDIEEQLGVAYIEIDDVTMDEINRIRLAEQFLKLLIIKK